MDLFAVLSLIGGLCLFLFGMNIMGQALERRAGSALSTLLGKLTTRKTLGFLTGLLVTAVIQSSSATTVMVVGFVNSGLLSLRQAINVIMGANVGTTVTAWLLSLSGISGESLLVQLLKPTSFTPVLALIGIVMYMFSKKDKSKDTGTILLGFAVLMFGMDAMSDAVSGLKHVPAFQQMFVAFENPILGVLAGAVLTAIIQSSSASVGILQALATTGQVSYGAAIPIIMGQNIGTCVTAILSCIGTTKNARRAAVVHLMFNILGTVIWLAVYYVADLLFQPILLQEAATMSGIAIAHSVFNIGCTIVLLPMSQLLEKLAYRLVPDAKTPETVSELDERLFATPAVALDRSRAVASEMAVCAVGALKNSLACLKEYSPELAEQIREAEEKTDHYEDILGSYLVRLSNLQTGQDASAEAAMLLKVIGDFERISDHSVNILEAKEEMQTKSFSFTPAALAELEVLTAAVEEILDVSLAAYLSNDYAAAQSVEPLEQVIDRLKEQLRSRHIQRLQQGDCTIEVGFVWSDLLTNLERTADHCSNIAGGIIDLKNHDMNMHQHLRDIQTTSESFREKLAFYTEKYALS